MSNRTLSIDDQLYDYILSVSVDESELLSQLRAETANIEFSEMQISPEQGQFMSLLVKLLGAARAIEIGTFTGYSSICIARALAPDGTLVCCDASAEWTRIAKKYWALAGLETRIDFRLQDALVTLRQLLDAGEAGQYDFVFIDADKQNYQQYYELSLELVRPGGLIAVDNTLWSGDVANAENNEPSTRAIRRFNDHIKRDARVTKSLVPIGDGLTLLLKPA
ncbi:MAG: class I SAM-dependent methyltransferase [Gammaproteobacteria bacterium]